MKCILLLFLLTSQVGNGQCPHVMALTQQGDRLSKDCIIQLLSREWRIIRSQINGMYVPPNPQQQDDLFHFFEDMTFERIENGTSTKGNWVYDEANNQIILKYADDPNPQQLSIEQADKEHLVLRQEEDWRFNMTMYLISEKVQNPCTS